MCKLPSIPTDHRPVGQIYLYNKDLPHSALPFNNTLQAVAYVAAKRSVTLAFSQLLSFIIELRTGAIACGVSTFQPLSYVLSSSWKYTDLISLVSPVFHFGDFNCCNRLWGFVDTNAKGLEVATFLLQTLKHLSICLLLFKPSQTLQFHLHSPRA